MSKDDHPTSSQVQPVALQRGEVLWVDDPSNYLHIVDGQVHLFAVAHQNHQPTTQRLHIATFGAKEIILPLEAYPIGERDSLSLFISPTANAVIEKRPMKSLQAMIHNAPQELADQLDIWLAHLLACMMPPQRPHNVRTFLTDGHFAELARREVAFPGGRSLIWISLREGGSSFLGRSDITFLEPNKGIMPIPVGMWFRMWGGGRVDAISTASILKRDQRLPELSFFSELYGSLLKCWLESQKQQAQEAFKSHQKVNANIFSNALNSLSSILNSKPSIQSPIMKLKSIAFWSLLSTLFLLCVFWMGSLVWQAWHLNQSREGAAERRALTVQEGPIRVAMPGHWSDSKWLALKQGAQLAQLEIQERGGLLNREFRIDFLDVDDRDLTLALQVAQSIVDDPSYAAIIGHTHNEAMRESALLYEYYGLIGLFPTFDSSQNRQRNYNNIFGLLPSAYTQGKTLSQLAQSKKWEHIVISYSNTPWGQTTTNAIQQYLERENIQITHSISLPHADNAPEYLNLIKRWKKHMRIDAILLNCDTAEASALIQACQQKNFQCSFVCTESIGTQDLLRHFDSSLIKNLDLHLLSPHQDGIHSQENAFTQTFETPPNYFTTLGYDTVHIYAKAVQMANSCVPRQVSKALKSQFENNGWSGLVKIGMDGQVTRNIHPWHLDDGTWSRIQKD
jgi:ABC-type branched-subunit amino acid transport system substrate-binding protein